MANIITIRIWRFRQIRSHATPLGRNRANDGGSVPIPILWPRRSDDGLKKSSAISPYSLMNTTVIRSNDDIFFCCSLKNNRANLNYYLVASKTNVGSS